MDGVGKNCNFLSSFSAMTALEASLTLCKKPRSILQWRKVNGLTDSSHQFNPQSVTQQLVHVHGGTTMPPPPPRGGDAHLGYVRRYIHFECGNNGEKGPSHPSISKIRAVQ